MTKLFPAVLTALFLVACASASTEDAARASQDLSSSSSCGTTHCWDPCTSAYVTVSGNECSTHWDSSHSCYKGMGDCASNGGTCGTTTCWDPCSSAYVPVTGNQCHNEWDSSESCYKAVGTCE